MSNSHEIFPVVPLRDTVVLPNLSCSLYVGREKSVRALEHALNEDTGLVLVSQKDSQVDDPNVDDLYTTGVLAKVLQFLRIPDGTVKVLVMGHSRMSIEEFDMSGDFVSAKVKPVEDQFPQDAEQQLELKAMAEQIRRLFKDLAKQANNIDEDAAKRVFSNPDPGELADAVTQILDLDVAGKQKILDANDVYTRVELTLQYLKSEKEAALVEKKVKQRVKSQINRTQREYYLTEQMKAIQRELGDSDDRSELDEIKARIESTKLSKEAREKALSELKKLRSMGQNMSEASVVRNYLDWILSLPWETKREIMRDLVKAEKILDEDHFGLEKVKERIIEYIAVQQRVETVTGPILCLVGPPGVGKTSLGQSAAKATGRDFLRISLGGVGDEAEIRGHRRTYIGSMPGRIIQSMKKAKSVNPLILLDEVDKLGRTARGDPLSALLEVLDPEQNSRFVDHYMEIEYDLSDVLFITTANYIANIPEPLLDRMEVISLAGYTEEEKLEIAKKHLIPKQRKAHGIKASEFGLRNSAVKAIIRTYTREAGVRNLERDIAKLARKTVTRLSKGEAKQVSFSPKNLEEFLGMPKFRYGLAEKEDQVGVATGLAWSAAGGDLLSIEAALMGGKGNVRATGKLGSVMKESIEAASTYVRSISPDIGVKPTSFKNIDIHVHIPEGATPKDGPSAGVAMVTSIVSALTGIKVRRDVAMTGEVTLRGKVLPIGGLKAKLLAAARGGIGTVLIPEENEKDIKEMSEVVTKPLRIKPVSNVREVLAEALVETPTSIEWNTEIDAFEPPNVTMHHENVSMAKH